MKLATLLFLTILAGCDTAETFVDAGGDGGGGGDDVDGGGGDEDDTWVGTASADFVDFNGNSGVISADVTWRPTSRDADGADYQPEGTVSYTLQQPGCTLTIDPPSHAIDPANDGYLRVDGAGTYWGFGGTFWDVTITHLCPPSGPSSMPATVAVQWLNAASLRPLTGPELISGDETIGAFHHAWSFARVAP